MYYLIYLTDEQMQRSETLVPGWLKEMSFAPRQLQNRTWIAGFLSDELDAHEHLMNALRARLILSFEISHERPDTSHYHWKEEN